MATTENTVIIGSEPDRITIFYLDSGLVPTSDYTTLVIYHGSAFNGYSFRRLLPLAAQYNFRIVIINRREYSGSSKYTDSEIKDLEAGSVKFLERISTLVADFLIYFTEKFNIPKVAADRTSGGFAVLGWSMGIATAMSFIAHPNAVSNARYTKLEPYVRDIILYDPPYLALGYLLPADFDHYDPWNDTDCKTSSELFANFKIWVTSYFDHPNVASGSIHDLDYRKRTGRASIYTMTSGELAEMFDEPAASRSEIHMYKMPMQGTIDAQVKSALFDETCVRSILPEVKISYIVCSLTSWHSMWGYMEMKREVEGRVSRGEDVRPVRFIDIPGANHFVHWDDPNSFLGSIANTIHT